MAAPFIVAAVRELLAADAEFTAIVPAARIRTRKPDDVTTPFALVAMPGQFPLDEAADAWSPLVQVSVWSGTVTDEVRVYTAAARAARVFALTRGQSWRGVSWRPSRVIDGPMPLTDDEARGAADPLVGAVVRVECRVHA